MDCLICHETTGTYAKDKNGCGFPNDEVDLAAAAKSVGMPERENCGSCHWYGGGGNNVKHGDLDETLADPPENHDVHMGGMDFTCQECHITTDHKIAGRSTTSAVSEGVVDCTDCHDERPHDSASPLLERLNDHTDAVSCQACHIPIFAKGAMTLTRWDWSRSGEEDKVLEQTPDKMKKVSRKKGLLVMEKNVRPAHAWFNGKHRRYMKGDPADLEGVTYLNPPEGDIRDPNAKITPYKIIRGVVPADARYGHLIVPKLFGDGYFKSLDWSMAAEEGMKAAGLEFSGEVVFAETIMHWRLNHEIAPKEKALSCLDCHRSGGAMDFQSLGYPGDPALTGGRFDAKAKKRN